MSGERLKVLVADDEPAVRSLVGALLEERGDCDLQLACDGHEALETLAEWHPDVLITDLNMPRMGGEVLASKALALQPDMTVVVETGFPSVEGAVQLMKNGVFDLITKPFSLDAFEDSLGRAIDHTRRQRVEKRVEACVETLLLALGKKDPYLEAHSRRVSHLCSCLATDLGMPVDEVESIAWMGLVHDIGKIGVSDAVLHKPGRLNDDEFAEMREHPIYSAEIIRPLAELSGWSRAEAAVRHHHERLDGKGYPDAIAGNAIPVEARIIAVCDTYDAMASRRPYQEGLSAGAIAENLETASGSQLDGNLVCVFLSQIEKYEEHVCSTEYA